MLQQSPTLAHATVFVYTTSRTIPKEWVLALSKLKNNVVIYTKFVPGYHQGAIAPMHDPEFAKLVDPNEFDWIIRTNPDVVMYNSSRLERMMGEPGVDAVLAACAASDVCGKPSGCSMNHVNTDFTAFRTKLYYNMTLRIVSGDAERWMKEILQDVVQNNRDRWISTHNPDRFCRLRLWGEIVHEHDGKGCSARRLSANER